MSCFVKNSVPLSFTLLGVSLRVCGLDFFRKHSETVSASGVLFTPQGFTSFLVSSDNGDCAFTTVNPAIIQDQFEVSVTNVQVFINAPDSQITQSFVHKTFPVMVAPTPFIPSIPSTPQGEMFYFSAQPNLSELFALSIGVSLVPPATVVTTPTGLSIPNVTTIPGNGITTYQYPIISDMIFDKLNVELHEISVLPVADRIRVTIFLSDPLPTLSTNVILTATSLFVEFDMTTSGPGIVHYETNNTQISVRERSLFAIIVSATSSTFVSVGVSFRATKA